VSHHLYCGLTLKVFQHKVGVRITAWPIG